MTNTELSKLHKSIATDFKIVTRKTEFWEIEYCYQILHDIKKLMQFGYLENVSLIMNDHASRPVKVKKYMIGSTNRGDDHRPGDIDWEEGDGHSLAVLLIYTPTFLALPGEERVAFHRDNLRTAWTASSVDGSFPHLSQQLSKMYTYGSSGVDRIDFN